MSEPFIVKKIDDEEASLDDYNSQGNSSFSKTCFHGINALSGLISSSSSFFFFLSFFVIDFFFLIYSPLPSSYLQTLSLSTYMYWIYFHNNLEKTIFSFIVLNF